jgi:5'-deoxynucleotidase YfbR-like HD superfamily hydrolase
LPSLKDKLYFIMEGSRVERFHTRPLLKPDTDGRHSHGVAMLCWVLTNGEPSVNLLMAALTHDLAEQVASDVSAPSKRVLGIKPQLAAFENNILLNFGINFEQNLTPDEQRTLNFADQVDGLLTCCEEANLGNRKMELVFGRWAAWLTEGELTPREREVLNAVYEISNAGPVFDFRLLRGGEWWPLTTNK